MATFKEDPALEVDESPEFWVDVKYDEATGDGYVIHGMAFDPKLGPEDERQIDYWRERGYPGADEWELNKPIRVYGNKAVRAAYQKRSEGKA